MCKNLEKNTQKRFKDNNNVYSNLLSVAAGDLFTYSLEEI